MAMIVADIVAMVNIGMKLITSSFILPNLQHWKSCMVFETTSRSYNSFSSAVALAFKKYERTIQQEIIAILQSGRDTVARLDELLRDNTGSDLELEKVELLTPSIKMVSVATSRVHFESLQIHLSENRLGCWSALLDAGSEVNVIRSSTLPRHLTADRHSMNMVNQTGLPVKPADFLIQQETQRNPTIDSIAKAVSRIANCLGTSGRKRGFQNQTALATFASAREYLDCAAWLLEHVRTTSMRILRRPRRMLRRARHTQCPGPKFSRPPTSDSTAISHLDVFLTHPGQRFFCVRAACCVRASYRKLTTRELFAAVTTKILPNDFDWPFSMKCSEINIRELMQICRNFLQEDSEGLVSFREDCAAYFASAESPVSEQDADLYLALVCLYHLKQHPRIILKPWADYHALELDKEKFPLHRYISVCWQDHCKSAEKMSVKVPNGLHAIVQAAWLASRRAELLVQSREAVKELDLLFVHGEALDIGLGLSLDLGFDRLANSYRKMGAKEEALIHKLCDNATRPTCPSSLDHRFLAKWQCHEQEGRCYDRRNEVEQSKCGTHLNIREDATCSLAGSTESFEVVTDADLVAEDDWVVVDDPKTIRVSAESSE